MGDFHGAYTTVPFIHGCVPRAWGLRTCCPEVGTILALGLGSQRRFWPLCGTLLIVHMVFGSLLWLPGEKVNYDFVPLYPRVRASPKLHRTTVHPSSPQALAQAPVCCLFLPSMGLWGVAWALGFSTDLGAC